MRFLLTATLSSQTQTHLNLFLNNEPHSLSLQSIFLARNLFSKCKNHEIRRNQQNGIIPIDWSLNYTSLQPVHLHIWFLHLGHNYTYIKICFQFISICDSSFVIKLILFIVLTSSKCVVYLLVSVAYICQKSSPLTRIIHVSLLVCDPVGCKSYRQTAKPLTPELKYRWQPCSMGV